MIDQIGIALCGVTAIFLTQSKQEKYRKFACLFGLSSQPFWFYSAFTHQQWGIFFVSFLYTLAWMKGIWGFWIVPYLQKKLDL